MTHLIYITDPMCSWCYGFSKELHALVNALPEVQLDIIVGGLRPYNQEPFDQALRETLLSHWQQVQQASGLPFVEAGLQHADFKYDTEPACRAVVAAMQLAPDLSAQARLAILSALQAGFYADGKNVTQKEVLAEITGAALRAQGKELSDAQVMTMWESQASQIETQEHFMQTQRWQISGFPTLVMAHQGQLVLLTNGYTKVEQLQQRIARILAEKNL